MEMNNQLHLIAKELEKQLRLVKTMQQQLIHSVYDKNSKEQYFTVKAVANIFQRSESTIRRWISSGKLKGSKLFFGGKQDQYLIPKKEVDRLIENSGL